VVLAGHVDTVPPRDNLPGSVEPEARGVAGLGASDMKGAIAVMLEVAQAVAAGRLATDLDLALLFFGREELPIAESALSPALARCAALRDADLAIVMEPTANALEIGCLGNLTATVTFHGRTAHSARPWLGSNAIHAAVRGLRRIVDFGVRDVEVGGLVYCEVASATTIEGGIASNVVPDEVRCGVNLRYAPTRAPEEAEAGLRELLAPDAEADIQIDIDIAGNAPPGAIPRDNPLVARLRSAGDLAVRPKQAWTPVAEFAAAGVDAVNLGPGDPDLAHRADERIGGEALVRSFEILCAFLSGRDAPLERREPVR
jgi:succinyl-diaminopimelate desuccinylase